MTSFRHTTRSFTVIKSHVSLLTISVAEWCKYIYMLLINNIGSIFSSEANNKGAVPNGCQCKKWSAPVQARVVLKDLEIALYKEYL